MKNIGSFYHEELDRYDLEKSERDVSHGFLKILNSRDVGQAIDFFVENVQGVPDNVNLLKNSQEVIRELKNCFFYCLEKENYRDILGFVFSILGDLGLNNFLELPEAVDIVKQKIKRSGVLACFLDSKDIDGDFSKIDIDLLWRLDNAKDYQSLFDDLGESEKTPDVLSVEKFGKITDSIERLEVLRTLSLSDKIRCLQKYSYSEAPLRYFVGRLDFYQKLIKGTATRKKTEQEWDPDYREWKSVENEYLIDNSNVTPDTVRLGLLRDTLFAAMMGTPELAIFKIAEKRLKKNDNSLLTHFIKLKGYHSGITENDIGYGYPFLRDIYLQARKNIDFVSDEEDPPEDREHRAVVLAANWLEEAMKYNNPGRGPESPYVGSLEEAVAWARLGESFKKQLLGMRRKIQGVDLHNIKRFIGRSGSGEKSYFREKEKLQQQIKLLREGDSVTKQKFVKRENNFAIKKQELWLARETEKVNRWFEKSKAKIASYDISEEERREISENVQHRYEEKLAYLQKDYSDTVEHLNGRSPEELTSALQERQRIVVQRFEKRKSLAHKALDLYFALNHEGTDYGSKPLGLVDWINYASFGTIKRSHRLLKKGVGEEQIVTSALVDIITGAREATPADTHFVQALVRKVKGGDHYAGIKLHQMSEVGNILSRFDHEVSLADVAKIAGQQFDGMTDALKLYDLDQVRQFLDQGVSLQSVVTVKRMTEKFGHDLQPVDVAALAAYNINGLESALRAFSLPDVQILLSQDVILPDAEAVLHKTKQFGYELSIQKIAQIAKNFGDVGDFTEALRGLPLEEVEKLFSAGLSYQNFGTVKSALKKHGLNSDFNSTLAIAQKLIKNNEFNDLDGALEFYTLQEVEHIIANSAPLSGMLQIRQVLERNQITSSLQETIAFTKASGHNYWNFRQCIDAFGIENVRKMATKSCSFSKALEVNNYINGQTRGSRWSGEDENEMPDSTREALRKGGVDVIIVIAKAGSIEAVVKTFAAGFTIEDITRFPYLISSLVEKP